MGNNSGMSNHYARVFNVLNASPRSSPEEEAQTPTHSADFSPSRSRTRQLQIKTFLKYKRQARQGAVASTNSDKSKTQASPRSLVDGSPSSLVASIKKGHWSEKPKDKVEAKVPGSTMSAAKPTKLYEKLKQQRDRLGRKNYPLEAIVEGSQDVSQTFKMYGKEDHHNDHLASCMFGVVPENPQLPSGGKSYHIRVEAILEGQHNDSPHSMHGSEQHTDDDLASGFRYPWEDQSDSKNIWQREPWAGNRKGR